MRALSIVVAVTAAVAPACSSDDPYPLRPPGGGGNGMHDSGPDAAPADASLVDAGPQQLAGEVCVVRDLTMLEECPEIPAAQDVIVSIVNGASTMSGIDRTFTVDIFGPTGTIEVGAGVTDNLVRTQMAVTVADGAVKAPAIDETLWETLLTSLLQDPLEASMVIYVEDGNGPVAGATLSGFSPGANVFYDDGAGGFDPSAVATGAGGIAVVVGTGAVSVTAQEGARSVEADVPTVIGGAGVGVLTLPTP